MGGLVSVQCLEPGPTSQAHLPGLMGPRAAANAKSLVETDKHDKCCIILPAAISIGQA